MSDQQDESLMDEASAPTDGLQAAHWSRLPGLVALVEGLALLVLFCFAPWFSWHGVNVTLGLIFNQAEEIEIVSLSGLHSYSGWAVAQGISIPGQPSPFLGYLWLIPLVGAGLVAHALLRLRHSILVRLTLTIGLVLSEVALLTEAWFYIQARQLQRTHADGWGYGAYIAASVSWGFWCAVGVNAAGVILVTLALLRLNGWRTDQHAVG